MEDPIDRIFKAGVGAHQSLYPASDHPYSFSELVASVGDVAYLVETSKREVVMRIIPATYIAYSLPAEDYKVNDPYKHPHAKRS